MNLSPKQIEFLARIRKQVEQKEHLMVGWMGEELLEMVDTLLDSSDELSSKEVSDLWEKMRYVGNNNSYLFFSSLNEKGLLNKDAVREFLSGVNKQ